VLRGVDIVDAHSGQLVLLTLSMAPSQIGLVAPFVLHGLQASGLLRRCTAPHA
jgi:hypothetical protein